MHHPISAPLDRPTIDVDAPPVAPTCDDCSGLLYSGTCLDASCPTAANQHARHRRGTAATSITPRAWTVSGGVD